MLSRSKLLLAVLALSCASVAMADAEKLAANCNACHGANGVSTDANIPTIAGMSSKYLAGVFKAYKGKERPCAETDILTGADKGKKNDMCKVIGALSDDDTKSLATYYSGKKFVASAQKFDAALAAKGKDISKKCEKCHSDNGSKAGDDSGFLAGQRTGYLATTLKDFAAGKRPMEKKMKAQFDELDQESLDALANYFASLGK